MPQEREQSEFSMDEKVWTKVGLGSLEMGAVNAAVPDDAHLRPGVWLKACIMYLNNLVF